MPHGFGASHLARWPSFADYVQKCVSRAQASTLTASHQPPVCSPRMASAIKRSRYRAGQRPVYPVACAELELTGGVERLFGRGRDRRFCACPQMLRFPNNPSGRICMIPIPDRLRRCSAGRQSGGPGQLFLL